MNDLALTDRQRERAREQNIARRQELEDLAAILASPAGERALLRILARLGLGQPVHNDNLQLVNFGCSLLQTIAAASPNSAKNITHALFHIG